MRQSRVTMLSSCWFPPYISHAEKKCAAEATHRKTHNSDCCDTIFRKFIRERENGACIFTEVKSKLVQTSFIKLCRTHIIPCRNFLFNSARYRFWTNQLRFLKRRMTGFRDDGTRSIKAYSIIIHCYSAFHKP